MDERHYHIETIIPVDASESEILARAASLNYLADFSVAETLVNEAKKRGLAALPATKFESLPGKGAKATINGMEVRVGSPRLLVESQIAVPVSFAERIKTDTREGKTVIVVLSGRSLSGAIILSLITRVEPTAEEPATFRRTTSSKPLLWLVAVVFSSITLFLLLR